MLRRALAVLCVVALGGCVKRVPLPTGPAKPETYKLLPKMAEAPTTSRPESRPDVYVETDQFAHTPKVVVKGEAGPLSLQGGRARICGDRACTRGIAVDNFILFEVVGPSGKVHHRFVVGYHPALVVAGQVPDDVGPQAFQFKPLDVTAQLPPDKSFRLRTTVLDYGGVGRVSAVYLRITAAAHRAVRDEDLRNE